MVDNEYKQLQLYKAKDVTQTESETNSSHFRTGANSKIEVKHNRSSIKTSSSINKRSTKAKDEDT